jgi:hypothetical protein
MTKFAALRETRNDLHAGATHVAADLRQAEADADIFISSLARLTGSMIRLRGDARLSAVVGQEPLSCLGEAQNKAIQGRKSLVEAHELMANLLSDFRIDPTAFGGGEEKQSPTKG